MLKAGAMAALRRDDETAMEIMVGIGSMVDVEGGRRLPRLSFDFVEKGGGGDSFDRSVSDCWWKKIMIPCTERLYCLISLD